MSAMSYECVYKSHKFRDHEYSTLWNDLKKKDLFWLNTNR